MQFSNIKAIVTGGVSGLGLAVAQRFAEKGAALALFDLNETQSQAAIASVTNAGASSARFYPVDVSDEAAVATAVQQAADDMDGLDIAVNCAGILGAGRVLGKHGAMPLDRFQSTVMVNLIGSFNVAKAAAERMQHNQTRADNERGVIINTASIAAWEGQIGQAAYSASKGGVVGMTLPMARELTRFGIRVMTIAPGVFHTPMIDTLPEDIQQALGDSVPFPKRLGKPEEFADLCIHIVENSYLNGSTIRLDGATRLEPQ